MVQYATVILSVYVLLVTIAAAIMGYLLTIPCGMMTRIKGENNKVQNEQKVDILSLNIELVNNINQCSTWQLIGFEVFE